MEIKLGNSHTEIQVTATQAKKALKSILGVDSQSLEGTFIYTGCVIQSKEKEIAQSQGQEDICLGRVTP